MASDNFKFKILGLEVVAVAVCAAALYLFVPTRAALPAQTSIPTNKPARSEHNRAAAQVPVPKGQSPAKVKPPESLKAEYEKKSNTIAGLASQLQVGEKVDLLVFVIDASESMDNDADALQHNMDQIINRYKGRKFQIVYYDIEPTITGEPTEKLADLELQFKSKPQAVGIENSLLALERVAETTKGKYKHPVFILMTDAAPNDFYWNIVKWMDSLSPEDRLKHAMALRSLSTDEEKLKYFDRFPSLRPEDRMNRINDVVSAIKDANADLFIWAAYDTDEAALVGTAANAQIYQDLVQKVGKGKFYIVKRGEFNEEWVKAN